MCCENLPQLFKNDGPELLHSTYSIKPHRAAEGLIETNDCVTFCEQDSSSLPMTSAFKSIFAFWKKKPDDFMSSVSMETPHDLVMDP